MSRIKQSEEKMKELFGEEQTDKDTADPDFFSMKNRFIYGDVSHQVKLSEKMQQLITLVVLTTNQNFKELTRHVSAALNKGVSPIEIKEAVYQCIPYIGFAKVESALEQVNEVFKADGVTLPVESQSTTTEESRFDKGLAVQKSIFGDIIDQMHQNGPAELKHIQNYLSAFCFGDIYTRESLDLEQRELLTLCILISLGGCENQVKSHISGNVSVGNTKETLISAITCCLPYIGFPRTLNALASLGEVLAKYNE